MTGGQAHASTGPVYRFVPIHLDVRDIEDAWPDSADEPRMYYNGSAAWADVVRFGGYQGHLPSTEFVGHTMAIKLYERDGGWRDSNLLGENTVGAFPLDEERRLRFSSNWWDYELFYRSSASADLCLSADPLGRQV